MRAAPITKASSITERRTWRRVAPSVRRVASSRVRCAIVIESVLAITKPPTNSAIPANASRKFWMIVEEAAGVVGCLLRLRFAGAHFRVGRQQGTDLAQRAARGCEPGSPRSRSRSSRPCWLNRRWATGKSKIAIVAPPSEDTPPIFTIPAMRMCCSAPRAITPIVWPTGSAGLFGGVGVDPHLARPRGPPSRDELRAG